jgi:hypothetical protein
MEPNKHECSTKVFARVRRALGAYSSKIGPVLSRSELAVLIHGGNFAALGLECTAFPDLKGFETRRGINEEQHSLGCRNS